MFNAALYRMLYMVVAFVFSLLLANTLMPAQFGELSLFIINAGVVSLFTGLGLESYVLHLLSNRNGNDDKAYSLVWSGLVVQLFLFTILQLISYSFFGKTLLARGTADFLLIEYFYFIGLIVVEKYVVLYYSLHNARLINKILFSLTICVLIVVMIIPRHYTSDYKFVLLLLMSQSLLQGLISVLVFHYKIEKIIFFKIGSSDFISALKISAVVMITNIIQLLAYRIDFWLLDRYHSAYEVGIYAQANKMANLIWVIPNILALLLIPKFVALAKQEIKDIFRWAFYANILIVCVTIIFSFLIFHLILAEEYGAGLKSLYIMIPGYFSWAWVIFFGAYFSWAGKFKINLLCSLFCFVFILISDLIFIPAYSISGAALSNSIAYSLTLFLYIFFFWKHTNDTITLLPFPDKNDFSRLQRILR